MRLEIVADDGKLPVFAGNLHDVALAVYYGGCDDWLDLSFFAAPDITIKLVIAADA